MSGVEKTLGWWPWPVPAPEVQDSGGNMSANESNDEIRVTEEMVSAAAEILWRDPFAGISESLAEEMARKMLIRALSRIQGK
jgi:hypothetical protein